MILFFLISKTSCSKVLKISWGGGGGSFMLHVVCVRVYVQCVRCVYVCVPLWRWRCARILCQFQVLIGPYSPFHMMAHFIARLQWSCAAKRYFFAGFLRVTLDIVEITVVDFFNKFVQAKRQDQAEGTEPLIAGDRLANYS